MNRPGGYYPIPPGQMALQGYQHPNMTGPVWAMNDTRAPSASTGRPFWEVQNLPDAPAYISTQNGRLPKRGLNPLEIGKIVRSDMQSDIQSKCASLRKAFPDVIRVVKKPACWEDLYYLWDAADIQAEGPNFLYYVMYRIGEQNEQLDREIEDAKKQEIDRYVSEWVARNERKVFNIVPGHLFSLFFEDPSEDINSIIGIEKLWIKEALEKYRTILIQRGPRSPNAYTQNRPNLLSQSAPRISYQDRSPTSASQTRASSDHGENFGQSSDQLPMLNANTNSPSAAGQSGGDPTIPSASPNQPQQYNHFMETQRAISSSSRMPPMGFESPLPYNKGNGLGNGFGNQPRPRENSIGNSRNRQYSRVYGQSQPNRPAYQSHYNGKQRVSGSGFRGSPSRVSQPEPVYIHNPQRVHASGTQSPSQPTKHDNVHLPGFSNDARNMPYNNSQIHKEPGFYNLGLMEDDPKLMKYHDSCIYSYKPSENKNTIGRTVYVGGATLGMFSEHRLKELFSECGEVESIRCLFRFDKAGPMFVTFENEVVDEVVRRFNQYTLADGTKLVVNYPRNEERDRSGSHSSYNSRNGEDHSGYTSKKGYESRPYPRRTSMSHHHPSRSQSGTCQNQYTNSSPKASKNCYTYPNTSTSQCIYPASLQSFPDQQQPTQMPAGNTLGCIISEVVQHERGIQYFQQQMPLRLMDNRGNVGGANFYPEDFGATRNGFPQNNINGRSRSGSTITPNPTGNGKENSPIKHASVSPTKNASNSTPGSKHKKQGSKQNTSTGPTPVATPIKSRPRTHLPDSLLKQTEVVDNPLPVENDTPTTVTMEVPIEKCAESSPKKPESIVVDVPQVLTLSTSVDPKAIEGVKTAAENSDTKAPETGRSKNKGARKQRKLQKSANKMEQDKGPSELPSPAIASPTETETTCATLTSCGDCSSQFQSRKPSLSSMSQISVVSKTVADQSDEMTLTQMVKPSEVRPISDDKINPSPVETDIDPGHRRTKTGSSTGGSSNKCRSVTGKEQKRQGQQAYQKTDAGTSSATSSIRKADTKTNKDSKKTIQDIDTHPLGKLEQDKPLRTESNLDQKNSSASTTQKDKKVSTPNILANSTEWPALGPATSPPSSIVDGKPPQSALPTLNFRKATDGIVPALPLSKPHRPSIDQLGGEAWPFVKSCKRKVS